MNTALETIREALAARDLSELGGDYAVYEDVYQSGGDGRDFADYGGPLHHCHTTPREVVDSIYEAAKLIDQIHNSGRLGGVRFGRVAFRPVVCTEKRGVTHIGRGKPEDEIVVCEITNRGYRVA
jgi:hypothetical protein